VRSRLLLGPDQVGPRPGVHPHQGPDVRAVPERERFVRVGCDEPLGVEQRPRLEGLVRGAPLVLGEDTEQGVAAGEGRDPRGRLSVRPDRGVQLPDRRKEVRIAQAGEAAFRPAGQGGVGPPRVRFARQAERPQGPGELRPRQRLGRLDELRQREGGQRLVEERVGLGPGDPADRGPALSAFPEDRGDLGALPLAAAGDRLPEHLVACGQPQLVARGDQDGLADDLPQEDARVRPLERVREVLRARRSSE